MRKHHRLEQHVQMWCFAHDHDDLFKQRFDSAFARGEAETLEQTAHLVLDISSKVDQLGAFLIAGGLSTPFRDASAGVMVLSAVVHLDWLDGAA
jgi:hypothetical protein